MEPLCEGAWSCMKTAAAAVRRAPFTLVMTAISLLTALVLLVDILLAYYDQKREGLCVAVGEAKEKKRKKKKKGKKKNRTGNLDVPVGGGDDALREDGKLDEVRGLERTEYSGGRMVVKGGGFRETEVFDARLVVEDENRRQPVCSGDRLVVKGEDMDRTECSKAVKGEDLCCLDVEDGESVCSDQDSLLGQCGDFGFDLNQPECSGHGLEVEKGELAVQKDVGADDVGFEVKVEQDDDDWEGIERSGLEDRFSRLVEFMASDEGKALLVEIGGDLRLKLYALRKVAMEGPCYKSRILFLTQASRARWNSWKSLGTMDPQRAMELYIKLLTDSFSGLEEKVGH